MLKQSENNSIDIQDRVLNKKIKDCSLLNRTDTKYVLNSSQAKMLFKKISNHYFVLFPLSLFAKHESYYFDLQAFYQIHNKKKIDQKSDLENTLV